jgi:hypothetical protein
MRFAVALLLLLTPLQGVTAAAVCFVTSRSGTCERAMAGMAHSGQTEVTASASGPLAGLCASPATSIAAAVPGLSPVRMPVPLPASTAVPPALDIRPAPPIHPPKV